MKARRFSSFAPNLLRSWQAWLAAADWQTRVGVALGVASVLLAFGVAFLGIAGPFPEGHFASAAVVGTAGSNMWRWGTIYPVLQHLDRVPVPSSFYMHHPMGTFWTIAVLGKVFGFHDWVLRLPPLFYMTATTLLLFLIGRALWGAIAGGLTALAYVSLPITLGYANYHDLEQPVMFGCVLATWGYLRFIQTWRHRHAAASVLGFVFALNQDWPAYIWGAFFLFGLFVYAYLIPERRRSPIRADAFGRYWALMCIGVALSIALEIWLLARSGRVGDLLASYANRSAGSSTPLSIALAARHYRINLMFTALAIVIGKIALPVTIVRAIVRRDHRELLVWPLFLCALIQYVVFKQGADVHIFWPHYFSAYFALAVGALAASVAEVTVWIGRRIRQGQAAAAFARAAPWAALVIVGLPVLVVIKDGLSIVRLARETGGRFAEAQLDSELDKEAVLRWFLAKMPAGAGIAYHPGIYAPWSLQWEVRPRLSTNHQPLTSPVTEKTRVYIMDTRKASTADIRLAATRFRPHAVGHIWMIDRNEPPAPVEGYALDEREPSLWERWLRSPTEPIRSVRPSPWVTWEWRTLLGQTASAPVTAPATTDELRIAHNVAVDKADAEGAAKARSALAAGFNLPLRATFERDTALLGAIHKTGARRGVTLFFLAGAFTSDDKFSVHAKVAARPRLSTLPADPADLEIASTPIWPTSLWRRGHIYRFEAIYRKRPGTEVITGAWAPGPKRLDGKTPLEIVKTLIGPVWAAAIWALGLVVSFIGWGGWVRRRLVPTLDADLGLRGAWGLSLTVAVGGLLCLAGIATRTVLLCWVFAGLALAAADLFSATTARLASLRRPWDLIPRRWDVPLVLALLVVVGLVFVGAAIRANPNPNDDWLAYIPFAREMQQTGRFIQPFSLRRMAAFGGQSVMQALTLIGSDDSQVHLFDQGIARLLLMLLVLGFPREAPRASRFAVLLLAVAVLMIPEVRVNSTSVASGALGFVAAFRTIVFADRHRARGWPAALLVALPLAAVCTLRQNYQVCAAFMVAALLLPRDAESWPERRRHAIQVVAMIGACLLPWVVLAFRSNNSFLFPLFHGNYDPSYAGLTPDSTWQTRFKLLTTAALVPDPVRLLPLWVLAAPAVARAWHHRAMLGLWLGAIVGFVLLVLSLPEADVNSIQRYTFAFVVALMIATALAASEHVATSGSKPDLAILGAVLVGLAVQIHGTQPALEKNIHTSINAAGSRDRGPPPMGVLEPSVRQMQAAVPPGERLLVMIERPYLLDFRRNRIVLLDQPGAVSPPPGLPWTKGEDAIADYLLGQGIRYFAFVLPDKAETLYSRATWTRLLTGRMRLWRVAAPVYLNAFAAVDRLAATRHHLFDDGKFAVIDLATRKPLGATP